MAVGGSGVREFRLLVDERNAYAHALAAVVQKRDKVRELEMRLAGGESSNVELLREKRRLEAEIAASGARMPLEDCVASANPLYAQRHVVLASMRLPPTARQQRERPDKEDCKRFLLSEGGLEALCTFGLEGLVWDDGCSLNVPYSRRCLYGMMRAERPCGVALDLEEDLLQPSFVLPAKPTPQQLEEARAVLEERERGFARRALWAVQLVRWAIAAHSLFDLGDAPGVLYYTGCTAKKNSFHVYAPCWECESPKALREVMNTALLILQELPEAHECRRALLRAPGTVPCAGNEWIIDWKIYCDKTHRQFRAAFQRKSPAKDNAFLPYDVSGMQRVRYTSRGADPSQLRAQLGATLACMAGDHGEWRLSAPRIGSPSAEELRNRVLLGVGSFIETDKYADKPRMLEQRAFHRVARVFGLAANGAPEQKMYEGELKQLRALTLHEMPMERTPHLFSTEKVPAVRQRCVRAFAFVSLLSASAAVFVNKDVQLTVEKAFGRYAALYEAMRDAGHLTRDMPDAPLADRMLTIQLAALCLPTALPEGPEAARVTVKDPPAVDASRCDELLCRARASAVRRELDRNTSAPLSSLDQVSASRPEATTTTTIIATNGGGAAAAAASAANDMLLLASPLALASGESRMPVRLSSAAKRAAPENKGADISSNGGSLESAKAPARQSTEGQPLGMSLSRLLNHTVLLQNPLTHVLPEIGNGAWPPLPTADKRRPRWR